MSRGGEPRRHADRAAQFMPFAALTGYYDAERISSELAGTRPRELVRVTYYADGAYVTREGMVARMDLAARELTVVRTRIPFDDVWRVERLSSQTSPHSERPEQV